MKEEDARETLKMAVQKFLATSHKPIKIQCFKTTQSFKALEAILSTEYFVVGLSSTLGFWFNDI